MDTDLLEHFHRDSFRIGSSSRHKARFQQEIVFSQDTIESKMLLQHHLVLRLYSRYYCVCIQPNNCSRSHDQKKS